MKFNEIYFLSSNEKSLLSLEGLMIILLFLLLNESYFSYLGLSSSFLLILTSLHFISLLTAYLTAKKRDISIGEIPYIRPVFIIFAFLVFAYLFVFIYKYETIFLYGKIILSLFSFWLISYSIFLMLVYQNYIENGIKEKKALWFYDRVKKYRIKYIICLLISIFILFPIINYSPNNTIFLLEIPFVLVLLLFFSIIYEIPKKSKKNLCINYINSTKDFLDSQEEPEELQTWLSLHPRVMAFINNLIKYHSTDAEISKSYKSKILKSLQLGLSEKNKEDNSLRKKGLEKIIQAIKTLKKQNSFSDLVEGIVILTYPVTNENISKEEKIKRKYNAFKGYSFNWKDWFRKNKIFLIIIQIIVTILAILVQISFQIF